MLALLFALASPCFAAQKIQSTDVERHAMRAVTTVMPSINAAGSSTPADSDDSLLRGLDALEDAAGAGPLGSDEERAKAIASESVLGLIASPGQKILHGRSQLGDMIGFETIGAAMRLNSALAGRPQLKARLSRLQDRWLGPDPALGIAAIERRLGHFFDLAVAPPVDPKNAAAPAPEGKPRRDELITAPQGERFTLEYEFEGRLRRLEGTRQLERERKINLPKLPVEVEPILHSGKKRLLDAEDIVTDLLDRFFWSERRDYFPGKVHPSPLAVDQVRWHNGMTFDHKDAETSREEPMTALLKGGQIYPDSENRYQSTYKLGAQFESAEYFDDPAGTLSSQGIALRAKAWFRREQMGEAQASPAARGIFLKRDRPGGGVFLEREESHVAVPAETGAEERLAIARALLAQESVAEPAGLGLSAIVDNLRYAVNLGWYHPGASLSEVRQIGFVTIDSFVRRVGAAVQAPIVQLEFELFPEQAAIAIAEPAAFEAFFAAIEARYGARPTRIPKYLQGN